MAAVTTAVAVGVAAGAMVYQADQANKQAKEAKKQRKAAEAEARKQEVAAQKQLDEAQAQQETSEAREEAIINRRRSLYRQQGGRSDAMQKGGTVLTSPLGGNQTLGEVGGEGIKTLLGV